MPIAGRHGTVGNNSTPHAQCAGLSYLVHTCLTPSPEDRCLDSVYIPTFRSMPLHDKSGSFVHRACSNKARAFCSVPFYARVTPLFSLPLLPTSKARRQALCAVMPHSLFNSQTSPSETHPSNHRPPAFVWLTARAAELTGGCTLHSREQCGRPGTRGRHGAFVWPGQHHSSNVAAGGGLPLALAPMRWCCCMGQSTSSSLSSSSSVAIIATRRSVWQQHLQQRPRDLTTLRATGAGVAEAQLLLLMLKKGRLIKSRSRCCSRRCCHACLSSYSPSIQSATTRTTRHLLTSSSFSFFWPSFSSSLPSCLLAPPITPHKSSVRQRQLQQ